MGFNENAFMIAGTAIAMFGVGLYIYDTRKKNVANAYNQYRSPNNYAAAPPTNSTYNQSFMKTGGSRKNRRKRFQKKTKKHR